MGAVNMEPDKKTLDKGGGCGLLRCAARDFFLGCVALLPLAVFAFLFIYLLYFAESIGQAIFGITRSRETTAAICVFLVLLLVYIGNKVRRRETSILSVLERYVISRIPVIGSWYVTLRDIIQNFTAQGGKNYLGTAKVPVAQGYIIGFVTKRETLEDGSSQVTIFVPTSPNPTTGLVFFFPESAVEYLDLTPERAFTRIISLGVKS